MSGYPHGDGFFEEGRPVIDKDGDAWFPTGLTNLAGAPTFATEGMDPNDGWPLVLISFIFNPLRQG